MSDAYTDATKEEKEQVVQVLSWVLELYKMHVEESEAQAPETEAELEERTAAVEAVFATNGLSSDRFVARLVMDALHHQINRLELLRHIHKEIAENDPADVSADVLATAAMLLQNVMLAIVSSSEFTSSNEKQSTSKLMLAELAEAIRLLMPTDFYFGNFNPLKTKF